MVRVKYKEQSEENRKIAVKSKEKSHELLIRNVKIKIQEKNIKEKQKNEIELTPKGSRSQEFLMMLNSKIRTPEKGCRKKTPEKGCRKNVGKIKTDE